MVKKLLILILLFVGLSQAKTFDADTTKPLSSVATATTTSGTDLYYLFTGAANKKIAFANINSYLRSLYLDTAYARLKYPNTFTKLNTFTGGIAGNGTGLNISGNSSILSILDTLIIFDGEFASHQTQITQNTNAISLTSISVYGSMLWNLASGYWDSYASKWDSTYPGVYSAFMDTALVHRGEITINSDNILLKVSSTDYTGATIASKLNLTDSTITIDAKHIKIDGTTTFSSGYNPTGRVIAGGAATDVNNNVTTISGGKITTKSLSADQIRVSTLRADSLTAGYLSADRIATKSLDATKIRVSSLVADSIKTGTLNGVSVGLGATSYTLGNGFWASSTAGSMFRVGNASASRLLWDGTNLEAYNSSNVKVASFGATNSFSGFSITGDLTMSATGTIKTAGAGLGTNGYILDVNGLRGYSSTLGMTFALPTNGTAPIFSSGIIKSTIWNLYTASVIRTDSTVGSGTGNAGVLINNTGIYGIGANKTPYTANFKLLASTGEIIGKLGTLGGWSMDSTKLYNTNALMSSTGYVSFGATPPTSYGNNIGAWLGYSSGAKLSLYSDASNFMQWNGSALSVGGATVTGGTIQTAASGNRIVMSASSQLSLYHHLADDDGGKVRWYNSVTNALMMTLAPVPPTGSYTIAGNLVTDYFSFSNDLGVTGALFVGASKFLVNSTGQLTKVNNLAASSYTGYDLTSDGTSFTPTVHGGAWASVASSSNIIDATGKTSIALSNTPDVYTINGGVDGKEITILNVSGGGVLFNETGNLVNIPLDETTMNNYAIIKFKFYVGSSINKWICTGVENN